MHIEDVMTKVKPWSIALVGAILALLYVRPVLASTPSTSQVVVSEPGGELCAPRLQVRHPQRCSAIGPGAEAARLARRGLYPQRPLPVARFDPSLAYLDFNYLRVNEGGVGLYPSAEAASRKSGAADQISPGFVYLSYYDMSQRGGSTVFSTPGGYVSGDGLSRVTPSDFHGLTFTRTPARPFGWINSGGTCTQRTPGGVEDYTGHCFTKFSPVQIYDKQHVDDWDWYLVAPDEWVEQRFLSLVEPDPIPPEGVDDDRWVTVNLYEQTVAAYEGGQLVFATVISSGRYGFWTQPGLFQVWAKLERDDMTGGIPGEKDNFYYLEDVPWVLYFDQARALHGTYWHAKFGTPTSRGCVNMTIADAHWMFKFADEGTYVYVFDPSGKTPTDPSAYGAGGA